MTGLLITTLWGCTTTSVIQPPPSDQKQQLLAMDNWRLKGKLGYRSGEQAGSAWIDWQQQQGAFQLTLSGPFGAGTTRIDGSPDHAVLTRSGKQPVSADSPAELTYLLFGWHWPVSQLHFWVRGLPYPDAAIEHQQHDTQGLLQELQQNGWQLQFSRYQAAPSGLLLPGKIKGQHGDLSFTLISKDWQL